MISNLTRFVALIVFAGLLLVSGEFGTSRAGAGPSSQPAAPGDLLSAGYDALEADRLDLARNIFQTLLRAYPQSTEAATAADELAALNGGDDPDESTPAARPVASNSSASPPKRNLAAAKSTEQLRKIRMRFLTDVGDRIFFAENSVTLGGRARAVVESQARWLQRVSGIEVTIVGRAADGGSTADNESLALARAHAVEAKLIEAGVDPSRIKVEGHGNSDSIALCKSPLCDAQNRQAESLLRYASAVGAQISSARGEAFLPDDDRAGLSGR